MKITKSLRILPLAALALGAVSAVAPSVFAEPNTTGPKQERREGRRGGGHMKIFEQLNLSEEQKVALKPVFEDMRTKMQALRQNQDLTREQKREQMKQIRTESEAKINAILTEEQRTKLAALRAEQRANRGERGKGNKQTKNAEA